MSERERYDHGVPCWVDHASGDPDGAAAFYTGLLGWEAQDMMPPDAPGRYLMCTLRGKQVAAISTQALEGAPPAWNTYVAVDDADAAAASAAEAGGTVLAGPFDVFAAGRMAVVRDPAGAVVSLWQAGEHVGAALVNEPGALAWNELTTRDVEGAQRFYGTVFGWRTDAAEYGGARYFTWHLRGDDPPDPRGAVGGMMPMDGDILPADLPPHWMTYFAVEEVDAAAARSRELGGAVAVAPFDTPAGRIAVLNDPTGAVVSIIGMAAA